MNDSPDWQAREAQAACDEQRRHPRPYPPTKAEQLRDEYSPENHQPKEKTE